MELIKSIGPGQKKKCLKFEQIRIIFQYKKIAWEMPGEIVYNTMTDRSSETVQRSGYFQSSVSYVKVKIMFQ